MSEPVAPSAGTTISVRLRRDLVIVDPDRFRAAARAAYRDLYPSCSDAEATEAVADVSDAIYALLTHAWHEAANTSGAAVTLMWPDPRRPEMGPGAPVPGRRVTDRADGLSPAGWFQQVVLSERQPLQDYGCFPPPDPFAKPTDDGQAT